MAAEIQLLACGYSAQYSVRGCRARATMLARYTDDQGRTDYCGACTPGSPSARWET